MARRRRIQHNEPPADETREQALCRRARRFERRGETRRALLALREAAHGNECDPRLWVLYGAQCVRAGKLDLAQGAFAHAAWLRDRSREPIKAAVTRQLMSRLCPSRAA